MFGELIGLWAAAVWKRMGSPENLRADRARSRPRHHDGGCAARGQGDAGASATPSCCIWSRSARRWRRSSSARWSSCRPPMYWHRALDDVPHGPAIILANEFFDALPVHQAVKTERRLARARDRDRRRRQSRLRASRPTPLPHFDRAAAAGAARRRPIGVDLRMARRHRGAGARPAARARRRRRADDRLRPCRKAPPATPCRRSASTPLPIR